MMGKYLHIPYGDTSGRMTAVALCGRLVGRMSLTNEANATCTKCIAESLARAGGK